MGGCKELRHAIQEDVQYNAGGRTGDVEMVAKQWAMTYLGFGLSLEHHIHDICT